MNTQKLIEKQAELLKEYMEFAPNIHQTTGYVKIKQLEKQIAALRQEPENVPSNQEVEKAGADIRLTNAGMLLQQAKNLIADYIDGVDQPLPEPAQGMPTDEEIEKWAINDVPKIFNNNDIGPVVDIAYNGRIIGAKWMRDKLKSFKRVYIPNDVLEYSFKLLREKGEYFISTKDEYADIIKDGKIKTGAKFLTEFVMSLYESGLIEFKSRLAPSKEGNITDNPIYLKGWDDGCEYERNALKLNGTDSKKIKL